MKPNYVPICGLMSEIYIFILICLILFLYTLDDLCILKINCVKVFYHFYLIFIKGLCSGGQVNTFTLNNEQPSLLLKCK